jgi:hypothetical protein
LFVNHTARCQKRALRNNDATRTHRTAERPNSHNPSLEHHDLSHSPTATLFVPIALYMALTLTYSLFGPVQYQHFTSARKIITFAYISSFLIVTLAGISTGVRTTPPRRVLATRAERSYAIRSLYGAIGISFLIKVLLLGSMIIVAGVPLLPTSLTDLAVIYTELHTQTATANIVRQLDTLLTFVWYFALIGGLYTWPRLPNRYRILLFIAICADLVYGTLYIATQRIFFTYFVIPLVTYLLRRPRKPGRRLYRTLFIALIASATALFLMTQVIASRFSAWGNNPTGSAAGGITYDLAHPWLTLVPDSLVYPFIAATTYPTQGYYGLGLSLSIPFEWSYGLGASRGLDSIVSQAFPNIPSMINTVYPARVEEIFGYPALARWHTVFPWFASDLTFLGTLIVMYLIAILLAKTYIRTRDNGNLLAVALFTLLVMFYLFVPANNLLFVSRGDTVAVLVLLSIWFSIGARFDTKEFRFRHHATTDTNESTRAKALLD